MRDEDIKTSKTDKIIVINMMNKTTKTIRTGNWWKVALVVGMMVVGMAGKVEAVGNPWWGFQSVDTMKYSRDMAGQMQGDATFDSLIDQQVKEIANTGATHVGIATPYDAEFVPVLKRWVKAARKYNLKVWFRGNLSGWEGWFGYGRIDKSQHMKLIDEFIRGNPDLFVEGDIFTPCPECENGGSGDPRVVGGVSEFRQFLIDEQKVADEAFRSIGANVRTNLLSMNADIARLIMDPETTKTLGGIVTIDHYVGTPEKLAADVVEIEAKSGGKVVLGEFGVPIPDIHGVMTEAEQAAWIGKSLDLLVRDPNFLGVSYWTGVGGSTQLWDSQGDPRQAVAVLTEFFTPKVISGKVVNTAGIGIKNAQIVVGPRKTVSESGGKFKIAYLTQDQEKMTVKASGYEPVESEPGEKVVLTPVASNYWWRWWGWLRGLVG